MCARVRGVRGRHLEAGVAVAEGAGAGGEAGAAERAEREQGQRRALDPLRALPALPAVRRGRAEEGGGAADEPARDPGPSPRHRVDHGLCTQRRRAGGRRRWKWGQ